MRRTNRSGRVVRHGSPKSHSSEDVIMRPHNVAERLENVVNLISSDSE